MYKESSKEFKESIEFTESGNSHDAFNRSNNFHTGRMLITQAECVTVEAWSFLVVSE